MPAQHYGVFTYRDYSNETSSAKFYNGAITAASLPGYLTNFGNLKTAINGLTLGTLAAEQWVGDNTRLSNDKPAEPWAQRENKWLVTYEGNTSEKLFQMSLPCANLAAEDEQVPPQPVLAQDGETANMNCTLVQDFITAFEAIARTPDDDTETVTVKSIRYVGRNL